MQLRLSDEVAAALESGKPVVALESTVISHGLPHPQNLETANRLEQIVRNAGVTPATIAIFEGEFHIGLSKDKIEFLASDPNIRKASLPDLPIAAARKLNCATTVATTAFAAEKAGIRVFATGGIGGVHRGNAYDVSADLVALSRTPIVVVCSGPKIVLDLPATREWIETFGIPVLGWQCDDMPAFYSLSSGLSVDERVESPTDVVALATARDKLGMTNAILVTVPIPEGSALDGSELETVLCESLQSASKQGISGKAITPFLLAELARRTGDRTLRSNVALLENNARVAAELAKAFQSI